MINGKKVVKNKSALFALTEAKVHYIKVDPNSDEYLKVWIKEPTWLEVDKAINSLMKIDVKSQDMKMDMNAMFKYMMENFIVKTEPNLSAIDMLKLSPFVGNQLKEILPNPLDIGEDKEKNEE